MDPTVNLAEQLQISIRISKDETLPDDHERLAELVIALDAWIRGGGFLPAAWESRGAKTRLVYVRTVLKHDKNRVEPAHVTEPHARLRRQIERALEGMNDG